MRQTVWFGFGATERLHRVLRRLRARRVFLVTGGSSFVTSGAAEALSRILPPADAVRYSGFGENPKIEDVTAGIAAMRSDRFDAVVAVGGGSVMDAAKLVNVLARQQPDCPGAIDLHAETPGRALPLIAIPTTSGSGSEATHFAVVYVDRVKHSVSSPCMLPDVAIVDPALTRSLPPRLTAVTGMDAFSQAVESYWCIHSTAGSRTYARRAIELILTHLPAAVTAPSDAARRAMSKAAHLAGRAINITKTTGAHALSYPLTSYFGIPHGHAVALTLGEFLVFNSGVTDVNVNDRRGAAFVRSAVQDLAEMMGCRDAEQCRSSIRDLMVRIGLQTNLGSIGISRDDALRIVSENVNVERLRNNPRAIDADDVQRLILAVC